MQYNIVFKGKLRDDIENDEIIKNLKKLLKMKKKEIIRQFFLGGEKTLKTDLSAKDARKYIETLYRAGVIVTATPYNVEQNSLLSNNAGQLVESKRPSNDDMLYDRLSAELDMHSKREAKKANQLNIKKTSVETQIDKNRSQKISKEITPPTTIGADDLYQHLSDKLDDYLIEKEASDNQTKKEIKLESLSNPRNYELQRPYEPDTHQPRRARRTSQSKEDILYYAGLTQKSDSFSLAYILSPHLRANRSQYIIRLLAAFVLLVFTDHVFNLLLFKIAKNIGINTQTILIISFLLLIVVGSLLLIFTIQRLHDLGRHSAYVLILILPISLTFLSQFSDRLDAMRINEFQNIKKEIVANGLNAGYRYNPKINQDLYFKDSINDSIKDLLIHRRLTPESDTSYQALSVLWQMNIYEQADVILSAINNHIEYIQTHSFNQRYKAIYIFSYVVSTILLCYLIIMKGDDTVNAYGAQQPFELSKPMIISISVIIGIFLFTLIFLYIGSSYDNLRQEYDQMFFETLGFEKTQ